MLGRRKKGGWKEEQLELKELRQMKAEGDADDLDDKVPHGSLLQVNLDWFLTSKQKTYESNSD